MITHTSLDSLWQAIFELAEVHGAQPLSKHDGCWCLTLDQHWFIAMNGKNEEKLAPYPDGTDTATLPPFSVFIAFNGWPFALIRPDNAEIACGKLANIDTLHSAIVSATERKKAELVV